MDQGWLLRLPDGEFQRIDPKSVMSRCALLDLESAGVKSKLAKQQGRIVGVCKATVVAKIGDTRVGKFAINDAEQASHLGDRRLVIGQLAVLQPVL